MIQPLLSQNATFPIQRPVAGGDLPGQKSQEIPGQRPSESGSLSKEKDPVGTENELSPEEKRVVAELAATEREVIAHERAHQSAGGAYTGSASYGYTKGPDGKDYITSGEVSIATPQIEISEKGLQVLEQVKRAALAPANPSGQDMRVASKMEALKMKIRAELAKKSYSGETQDQKPQIDQIL